MTGHYTIEARDPATGTIYTWSDVEGRRCWRRGGALPVVYHSTVVAKRARGRLVSAIGMMTLPLYAVVTVVDRSRPPAVAPVVPLPLDVRWRRRSGEWYSDDGRWRIVRAVQAAQWELSDRGIWVGSYPRLRGAIGAARMRT